MYEYVVTVLTPTYNRCNTLPTLYESLCNQSHKNFQWLIVDDGSVDKTKEYINSLSGVPFDLQYVKKENGGKHTALNYSHPYIKGEVVVIVDSDDYLIPEAIQIIEDDWKKYRDVDTICGLSYLKGKEDGSYLSKKSEQDYYIDNDIRYRINNSITGDRCEVIRTDLLREYPFPEFKDERFMSEGWLWHSVALNYDTVYRNEVLYICEYLEDGLSKAGRKLRMECPYGMMENCKVFLKSEANIKIQIKQMWLFWVYGLCARLKFKQIVQESEKGWGMILNAPFGIAIYLFWRARYLKS